MEDLHDLIENARRELRAAWAAAEGNAGLRTQIEERLRALTLLQEEAELDELNRQAAILNALSDLLDRAIAEIRHNVDNFLFDRFLKLKRQVDQRRGIETASPSSPTRPPSPSREPGGGGDVPDAPPAPDMDRPGPAPAGTATAFVSARKLATKVILFTDREGREFIKEGGSRAWRNNNPGNIRKGNFASAAGAIGDDDAFAIFPDYKTGFDAIVTLLRSPSYTNLSLRDAVFRYAPPNENDSEQYLAFLERETGVQGNIVLSSLAVADIRKVAKVIQTVEGWQPGIERADRPPSDAGVPISSAAGAALDWMEIAKREAALPERERTEWTDPGENPRILNYFKVGCAWFEADAGDEVDWCAAFVNYCLVTSGFIGTNHPGARSFFWNKKNQFIKLDAPRFGAIAVRRYAPFDDPQWPTGEGHVGFVHAWTSSTVTLLGGNQSRSVRLETYPLVRESAGGQVTAKFVAFMMPSMN